MYLSLVCVLHVFYERISEFLHSLVPECNPRAVCAAGFAGWPQANLLVE